MIHLRTFEGWRDSEKLNKLNRLTGLFDSSPICEIEEGDVYGMRDDVVKAHYIQCGDNKIYFEKITGEMDDSFNRLEFTMSDGKSITMDCFWTTGPYNPNPNKNYFKMECNTANHHFGTFNIDPDFALDDIISNFGDGAHLLFAMLFYPNCDMYYEDKKVILPEFKFR